MLQVYVMFEVLCTCMNRSVLVIVFTPLFLPSLFLPFLFGTKQLVDACTQYAQQYLYIFGNCIGNYTFLIFILGTQRFYWTKLTLKECNFQQLTKVWNNLSMHVIYIMWLLFVGSDTANQNELIIIRIIFKTSECIWQGITLVVRQVRYFEKWVV